MESPRGAHLQLKPQTHGPPEAAPSPRREAARRRPGGYGDMERKGALLALLLIGFVLSFGCGVKGKPVPKERVIPSAPGDFSAEVLPEGVRLSWRAPQKNVDGSPLKDLEAVEIWRADLAEGECPGCPVNFRKIGEVAYIYPEGGDSAQGATEYLDQDLGSGLYRYRLVGRNSRGLTGQQSAVRELYWDIPPGVVQGVLVSAGDRQVELRWEPLKRLSDGTPLGLGDVSYQVFRGYKGRGLGASPLHEEPLQEPHFVDRAVQNYMAYHYRVRAVRHVKGRLVPGPFCPPVEATPRKLTPPDPPRGVVAFATAGGIRVVWEGARGAEVTGYRLYKATAREGPWDLLTDRPLDAVVYDDRAVERGRWYWYSVTALDDALPPNESVRSEPVGVRFTPTPQPGPSEGGGGGGPASR